MFDKLFALVELSFVDTHTVYTILGTGTIMSLYKPQFFFHCSKLY